MDQRFIVNRNGKEFVVYAGLLDEAHRQGLKRIGTTLIQIPADDNGNMAIVQAEVETDKGVYAGIGDASPENVNRMIAPHLLRMAETRAKARALRDAVNVGVTALEELGDDAADESGSNGHGGAGADHHGAVIDRYRTDIPTASPDKLASANQLATIAKLSRMLGEPEEPGQDMTSAQASDRISELSREYNSRKAAPARRRAS